jgi:hypothetical protein
MHQMMAKIFRKTVKFRTFDQLSALKILKSQRPKVVSKKYSHLSSLQACSIFAFEIFPYKNGPA